MSSQPKHPADRIAEHLAAQAVVFKRMEHAPAASAEEYNRVLGCRLSQQVKVLLLKIRKQGTTTFAPYALPGGKRADLKLLEKLLEADKISLSSKDELFSATGCRFGELHPIASIYGMKLVFDNELMLEKEVLFNAGVHEQSIAIAPQYLKEKESQTVVGSS